MDGFCMLQFIRLEDVIIQSGPLPVIKRSCNPLQVGL